MQLAKIASRIIYWLPECDVSVVDGEKESFIEARYNDRFIVICSDATSTRICDKNNKWSVVPVDLGQEYLVMTAIVILDPDIR